MSPLRLMVKVIVWVVLMAVAVVPLRLVIVAMVGAAFVTVVVVGCVELGSPRSRGYTICVDKQWNKPLAVGTCVALEYAEVEDSSGKQWLSDVTAMSPRSPINEIPADCTVYVYPEKAVRSSIITIHPIGAMWNSYYLVWEGDALNSSIAWRGERVQIGGSSTAPKIAATYRVSIPSTAKAYSDLFVLMDPANPLPFSLDPGHEYILVRVRR